MSTRGEILREALGVIMDVIEHSTSLALDDEGDRAELMHRLTEALCEREMQAPCACSWCALRRLRSVAR